VTCRFRRLRHRIVLLFIIITHSLTHSITSLSSSPSISLLTDTDETKKKKKEDDGNNNDTPAVVMEEEENPNDKKNEKEEESKEEATTVVSTNDNDAVVATDIVLADYIVKDDIVLAVDIAKEDTTIIVFTAILFFLNWWTSDPTKAALDHLDETVDVRPDTERFQKICLNSITVWLLLHVTSNTSHVTSFIVIHHEKILLLLNLMTGGPTKAEVLDRPNETLDDHADIGWVLYIGLNAVTVWFFLQFTSFKSMLCYDSFYLIFNRLKYIKRKYHTDPTTTTNTTGNSVSKPNTGGCGHIRMIMKKTMITAMVFFGIFHMPNKVTAFEPQWDDNNDDNPHYNFNEEDFLATFNPLDPEHVRPFDILPSTHHIPDSMPSPAVIGPLVIGSPPSTSSTFALISPSTSTRSASSTLPSDTTTSFLPNSSFSDASSHIFNANYTDLFDDDDYDIDDDFGNDEDYDDLNMITAINRSLQDSDPNHFNTEAASLPQTSAFPSGGPSGYNDDYDIDENEDDLNINIAINNSLNDLDLNYFDKKAASLPQTSSGPNSTPSGGPSGSPSSARSSCPSGSPNSLPSGVPSGTPSFSPTMSPAGGLGGGPSDGSSSSSSGGPSVVDEDYVNDQDDDDLNMITAINRSLQDSDPNHFNTEAASKPTPVVLQTITNRHRRSITPSTPKSRITSYKQKSISDIFSLPKQP
jgi:hypothetical protein